MNFWKYRAFNDQFVVIDGVSSSPSFDQLALSLRQKGLQIITASSISRTEYQVELRLQRLKDRLNQPSPVRQLNTPLIHRVVAYIFSIFRKQKR